MCISECYFFYFNNFRCIFYSTLLYSIKIITLCYVAFHICEISAGWGSTIKNKTEIIDHILVNRYWVEIVKHREYSKFMWQKRQANIHCWIKKGDKIFPHVQTILSKIIVDLSILSYVCNGFACMYISAPYVELVPMYVKECIGYH